MPQFFKIKQQIWEGITKTDLGTKALKCSIKKEAGNLDSEAIFEGQSLPTQSHVWGTVCNFLNL